VYWRGIVTASLMLGVLSSPGLAQVMGPKAEMERLEQRAEDSIANGDPEAAAMNMGKAALMALELGKRQQVDTMVTYFKGLERLFRAQEHTYRAVALFERAGSTTPASSGVCATIRLAGRRIAESVAILNQPDLTFPSLDERDRYRTLATDWVGTIEALKSDFQCHI
jgi:hypothetical protein